MSAKLKEVLEHFSSKLSSKEIDTLEELLDAPKYFYRNLFSKLIEKELFFFLEVDKIKKVIEKVLEEELQKRPKHFFNSVYLDIKERVANAFSFNDIEVIIKPYRNFSTREEFYNFDGTIIYRLIHLLKDSVSFGELEDTDKSPKHMGKKFSSKKEELTPEYLIRLYQQVLKEKIIIELNQFKLHVQLNYPLSWDDYNIKYDELLTKITSILDKNVPERP